MNLGKTVPITQKLTCIRNAASDCLIEGILDGDSDAIRFALAAVFGTGARRNQRLSARVVDDWRRWVQQLQRVDTARNVVSVLSIRVLNTCERSTGDSVVRSAIVTRTVLFRSRRQYSFDSRSDFDADSRSTHPSGSSASHPTRTDSGWETNHPPAPYWATFPVAVTFTSRKSRQGSVVGRISGQLF